MVALNSFMSFLQFLYHHQIIVSEEKHCSLPAKSTKNISMRGNDHELRRAKQERGKIKESAVQRSGCSKREMERERGQEEKCHKA